jgi:hypothetical protein
MIFAGLLRTHSAILNSKLLTYWGADLTTHFLESWQALTS